VNVIKLHTRLLVLLAIAPGGASAECPVTLPSSSPVDVPNSASNSYFGWFGSEALAVLLPADGRWRGMGPSHKFRNKFWIWRRGYEATAEPKPALTFRGTKLMDGDKPERIQIDRATNAFGEGWSQMLTLMEFPSAGCWKVTAKYVHVDITQELTFVVDVIDDKIAQR
jgi:hypothetical protein